MGDVPVVPFSRDGIWQGALCCLCWLLSFLPPGGGGVHQPWEFFLHFSGLGDKSGGRGYLGIASSSHLRRLQPGKTGLEVIHTVSQAVDYFGDTVEAMEEFP